jgi:hypothetical protein
MKHHMHTHVTCIIGKIHNKRKKELKNLKLNYIKLVMDLHVICSY